MIQRVLASLVLASLLAPMAMAQGGPLLEDDAGDVQATSFGTPLATPAGWEEASDLVSFDIQEDAEGFHFVFGVVNLQDTSDTAWNEAELVAEFYHGEQSYQIRANRLGLGTNDFFSGALFVYDPGFDTYRRATPLNAQTSLTDNTVSVFVPRHFIPDEGGAPARIGSVFDRFVVTGQGGAFVGFGLSGEEGTALSFTDRMPDAGPSNAVFAVRLGLEQSGNARLFSPQPFRISNGEATTFVYTVEAVNLGNESDVFIVEASDVPKGWSVDIPGSTMRIDGDDSEEFPVVVRTPFAHQHGDLTKFLVELQSQRNPDDVGRIELGVRYPAIAQPGGHHDTLYFHSASGPADPFSMAIAGLGEALQGDGELDRLFMNTLEDDARDEGINVSSDYCDQEFDENATNPFVPSYCWAIPLDPGLQMGLDLDLGRIGSLTATIDTLLPAPAAYVHGELRYARDLPSFAEDDVLFLQREGLPIARIAPTAPVDMSASSSHEFEAQVIPLPAGDDIPYERGGALFLLLKFVTDRPENFFLGPKVDVELQAGGRIQVPLLDYEDPVEEVYDSGDLVELRAITEQQRFVNPGKTVVFRVEVTNQAGTSDKFRLDLVGSNQEWGTILSSRTINLDDRETAVLDISVTPPAEAVAGDRADLILEVASTHDINVRGLIRFVATVATDQEYADEGETAAELAKNANKESPGFEAVAMLALLGAVAVLARRR